MVFWAWPINTTVTASESSAAAGHGSTVQWKAAEAEPRAGHAWPNVTQRSTSVLRFGFVHEKGARSRLILSGAGGTVPRPKPREGGARRVAPITATRVERSGYET